MYNTELAEEITAKIIRLIRADGRPRGHTYVMLNSIDLLSPKIEELILSELNSHQPTKSLPTTCDEPGIAY